MTTPPARNGERNPRPHQVMGPGHEFDTIRMLMSRWGDLAEDIGDDAAVLTPDAARVQVITTDACVENAHFQRPWISPHEVGHRAAAAAISDVAAMGAHADAILVAMVVPDSWRDALGEIADGIGEVVRDAGARIIGGNLSRGDCFSITTTAIGSAATPVSRSRATVGDILVVTGTLGGPGQAITAWKSGTAPSAWARQRFAAPVPRLAEGAALAAAGATAMIDISDGLAADARHLAAASGVALRMHAFAIPCGPGVAWSQALASGEEYELLAAIPAQQVARLFERWPAHSTVPLTVIGTVVDSEPAGTVSVMEDFGDNKPENRHELRVDIIPGHDHFTE